MDELGKFFFFFFQLKLLNTQYSVVVLLVFEVMVGFH